MKLKDISIAALPHSKYEAMGFNWETHCVEDLYLRNLLPYENKSIEKLNIRLVGKDEYDLITRTGFVLSKFIAALSVGEVFLEFDFDHYYNQDEYHKKLYTLNKIQEGFIVFATETKSDILPFKNAYQKCMDQNLQNSYLYKEVVSKISSNRVKVIITVDTEKLEVVGVFQDRSEQEISRNVFFSRKPDALFYHNLGNVVWTGEREVTLYGRSKAEFWKIEL